MKEEWCHLIAFLIFMFSAVLVIIVAAGIGIKILKLIGIT